MNFKKNLKRFMTLNRHHAEGFTLVELIVVIAILAILGGVAVPAYGGYVKKANMQADLTLISEIEHALTLAGYSGTFAEGEGGYLILTADGSVQGVEAGSNLEKALIATFGANYADTLKLKYDAWGNNGLYNNLTPESAAAVKLSSYMTGNRVDDLLSDVETMTSMANNLVTVLGENNGFTEGTTLSGMFTKADGTCVLDETATKYGVVKGENETWEEWAAKSNDNNVAYSNLLVMAAADEAEKKMSTQGQYQMSGASEMILEFSSFYAYAATNPEFSETMDEYMAHLNGTGTVDGLDAVTDASSGAAWYNSLKAQAGAGYNTYAGTVDTYGQGFVDQQGFLSILAGLGNPSEDQASSIAADLSNANLFTNGVVNGMYNEYLDGVDAMYGMYDPNEDYSEWSLGLDNGNVAVIVIQKNGRTIIVSSLPAV